MSNENDDDATEKSESATTETGSIFFILFFSFNFFHLIFPFLFYFIYTYFLFYFIGDVTYMGTEFDLITDSELPPDNDFDTEIPPIVSDCIRFIAFVFIIY